MVTFPHAKINIGLNVVSKRPDGYHNIITCFYPFQWTDALEILPSDRFNFSSSGIAIPGNEESNLCIEAFRLLEKAYQLPPVKMHLHKAIPMGAGLGGGSSDAAFALKTLNQIFNLSLTAEMLRKFAGELGSDCPFFVQEQPAIATGTGTVFEPTSLSLKSLFFVVVNPNTHIGTAEAYQSLIPKEPEVDLRTILKAPISEWKDKLVNDFETPVFKKFPEVRKVKEKLYELGALYAAMSGSGSSVYGLFENSQSVSAHFPDHYLVWEGTL